MRESINKGIKEHGYMVLLFAVVTILFLLLYNKFIFGDFAYLYTDVGLDTLGLYYPNQVFCADTFRNGSFAEYSLQYGLGKSIDRIWTSYFNPFDWIIFLCTKNTLHIGLLISTYIKYIVIALVSFSYFKKLFDSEQASFIGSLLWTFCSYMIIWGQHYQFLTYMALFTIIIYFLHDIFNKTIYTVLLLVLNFSFLLIASYYFFYMIGIFSIFYIIGYHLLKRDTWKKILCDLLYLSGIAAASICIAAFSFFPKFSDFLNSARGMSANSLNIFSIFECRYLIEFIGSLLSADLFGVGNDFHGIRNYYESAKLFVGVIFIFSLVYHYMKKRLCAIMISILCILSILFPVFSMFLTGSAASFRWTYLICFLMCTSIVYMLKDLFDEKLKEIIILKKTSIISGIIYFVLISFIMVYCNYNNVEIEMNPIFMLILFLFLYILLFCLLRNKYSRKCLFILMLILCSSEIICFSYSGINKRGLVEKSALKSDLYNNAETQNALDYIKKEDAGLYRTTKIISQVHFNDALVQKYNGMSSYNSVNTSSLVDFCIKNDIGLKMNHPNFVFIGYEEIIINSLLSCKYLIGSIDHNHYNMYNKRGNNVNVYENTWSLPFGYVYTNKIGTSDYGKLSKENKNVALTNGFYFTRAEDEKYFNNTMDVDKLSMDIQENIHVLQTRGVKEAQLREHTYMADIPDAVDGMLCIPIIFDDNWKVYLDGMETEKYNINGGLIGVNITKGNHNIKMVYSTQLFTISGLISLFSFIVYCVSGIFVVRKYKFQKLGVHR